MVERRFIEVHGMFFFSRVVRILEGPIYDSISVYLKTSVIHYQKKICCKQTKNTTPIGTNQIAIREKDSQPTIIINKHRIFFELQITLSICIQFKIVQSVISSKTSGC